MLDFPAAPVADELFEASNGVTYQWRFPPEAWVALSPEEAEVAAMSPPTWSDLPVWSTTSLGTGGVIDSPDLSAYRELLVQINGLQHNTPSTAQFMMQFSSDGVTYQTGSYSHAGALGSSGIVFADAVPQATHAVASMIVTHFNVARETWVQVSGGLRSVAGGARNAVGKHALGVAWRNIRFTNIGTPGPGAVPFTVNGNINVYAKNP